MSLNEPGQKSIFRPDAFRDGGHAGLHSMRPTRVGSTLSSHFQHMTSSGLEIPEAVQRIGELRRLRLEGQAVCVWESWIERGRDERENAREYIRLLEANAIDLTFGHSNNIAGFIDDLSRDKSLKTATGRWSRSCTAIVQFCCSQTGTSATSSDIMAG